MTRNLPKLAVLDDEAQMRKALWRLLRSHGFEVQTYAAGEDLLTALSADPPDCLLLDLHMPGMTGLDVLEAFRRRQISLPVIVISGHDEPHNAVRVRNLGAVAYLTKPIDSSCLLEAIDQATSPGNSSITHVTV